MFKVIVITKQQIKYHHSTLNRQIVSEERGNIEFSPQHFPQKNQKHIKNIQNQKNEFIKCQNFGLSFKVTQIIGQLKIFHQYEIRKSQQSLKQSLIQKKRQQATILAHFKTNVICVLNVISGSENSKILSRLKYIQNQIQYLDIFKVPADKKSEQQNIQFVNLVIYLKNTIFSDELFKIFYKEFQLLPIYSKEVVIAQKLKSQDLSYQEIMNFFKYSQYKKQIQIQVKKQQQTYRKRWIQLPKCPACLLRLEFQISGIEDKILFIVSESKQNKISCKTCQIIENHQKSVQQNRKLSYEQDYKIDYKSEKHTQCEDCKQNSDIWICMVCSSVGCGRYKNADAYKHFVKSGHAITIDLETQRVWNYLSDCFSHKLLKTINQTNVKFSQLRNQQGQNMEQTTLQAAFWEYCSIFSEQMERQRIFYDNIKKSQKQKFQNELSNLDQMIDTSLKQKEQKQNYLKKIVKQKMKYMKKEKQIIQKVQIQRQLLKEYEQNLSNQNKSLNIQIDEDVINKKKQLLQLQNQMNQILIQLSNSI